MTDRNHPIRRHWIDQATNFGQHTFVAVSFGATPDTNVWRCTGCSGTILGTQLEDNLWQYELGVTCPAFAAALTNLEDKRGHDSNSDGADRGERGARDRHPSGGQQAQRPECFDQDAARGTGEDRPAPQSGRWSRTSFVYGLWCGAILTALWNLVTT